MLLSSLSKIISVVLISSLMTSFHTFLVVWRSLQLFTKYPFLYLSVLSLTCSPVSKFPNCNLKCFLPLYKIFVSFVLTKMYLLQNRLFSALFYLPGLLSSFNTLLHFPEFVETSSKHLNDLLPIISMLCSSFISYMSLRTCKYSVLRICTFKPHLLSPPPYILHHLCLML